MPGQGINTASLRSVVIQQDVHYLLGIVREVEGTRHFFKDLVLC